MNWAAISFDWNQVRAFLAAAEEGSLSAAARALRTTQPTLSSQVGALEQALGVTLFERGGRGLVLTDAGRDLVDHVREMAEAAGRISLAAARQSQEVAGEVSVTATDLMSVAFLPAIAARLRETAPGIRLQIIAANDIRDLMRREADIAIRHVRPDQPELIARHLGDYRANLYASSTYLDRIGRPRRAADLATAHVVGASQDGVLLRLLAARGIDLPEAQVAAGSDSGVVVWELVRAGLGMTLLPEKLADGAAGIERVLPDFPAIEFPVWIATHRELHTSRRIRVVFDTLAELLAA